MKISNTQTTKFAMLGLISIMAVSCSKVSQDEISTSSAQEINLPAAVSGTPGAEYVPNQLLVKFKAGLDAESKNQVFGRFNAKVQEHIHTAAMKRAGDREGLYVVNMPLEVFQAISQLRNMPEIEYAEPNYILKHQAVSNDPYYTNGSLWGMYSATAYNNRSNQFGCHASTAWNNNKTGSDQVYIAIIDEGVMWNHADLAANMGVNPGETANNGIDDDGNGYKDDIYGWDFAGNNNSTFDGTGDDHGTHVAGTIGARSNSIGVAGVCWNVKMLNCKFLGQNGGTTANAIKSVDYVTDLKTRHSLNIVATNNSWGGGGYSQGLYDAINRANTANILFIAAAGNSGTDNDVTASYPSNYNLPNVIAVASITSTGGLSSFSQYGLTTVDLGAPGSSIYSTLPVKSGKNIASGYGSYSGTSMATPHVTGAAALYAASNPSATAAQIKAAILNNTISTASLSGKCVTGGRLNVSNF